MARITQADESARMRLRRRAGAGDARAPFREAIAGLQGDEVLEIRPENDETMRGLKVNVGRAAGELSADVQYGETVDGALLVWRRSESGRRGRRRRQEA
jgi:hypothetical protein